jgi:hypothetical protein
MNTRLLMTVSAIAMGITGIVLSFIPHEVLHYFNRNNISLSDPLIVQMLGAVYFAFAMMNWTAKGNLIGGIYGRPIAISNLTHFVMGSLLLVKGYAAYQLYSLIIPAVVYSGFAISYAIVFFTHPVKGEASSGQS